MPMSCGGVCNSWKFAGHGGIIKYSVLWPYLLKFQQFVHVAINISNYVQGLGTSVLYSTQYQCPCGGVIHFLGSVLAIYGGINIQYWNFNSFWLY